MTEPLEVAPGLELMQLMVGLLGLVLLLAAVGDAFQTVVVARHAVKLPAITRLIYGLTWTPLAASARMFSSDQRRASFLGLYGPLSLLLLLISWAASIIVGFALLQWSVGHQSQGIQSSLSGDLYFSAASFFTLGAGEPRSLASKYLMVLEAGFGFTFLGLVIGYLPVLYQSFSDRELRILLLDARAGSPPSAAEFIRRRGGNPTKLEQRLAEWEEWALDLLQNHLSYPMLAYYRSQHANQSWLAALTAVVDVSALAMLGGEEELKRQAELTFAAGCHAMVHTASLFRMRPRPFTVDRLDAEEFSRLRAHLVDGPTPIDARRIDENALAKLRASYEPHANALSSYFCMPLPRWLPDEAAYDNWQVRPWER